MGQFLVSLETPENAALARRRPALSGENGGPKTGQTRLSKWRHVALWERNIHVDIPEQNEPQIRCDGATGPMKVSRHSDGGAIFRTFQLG